MNANLFNATRAYSGNEDSASLKTIVATAIIKKYSVEPDKFLQSIRDQAWDHSHDFYFMIRKLVTDGLDKVNTPTVSLTK